jgi:hypothetical protein
MARGRTPERMLERERPRARGVEAISACPAQASCIEPFAAMDMKLEGRLRLERSPAPTIDRTWTAGSGGKRTRPALPLAQQALGGPLFAAAHWRWACRLLDNFPFLIGQLVSPETWPSEVQLSGVLCNHLNRHRRVPNQVLGLDRFAELDARMRSLNPRDPAFDRNPVAVKSYLSVSWWNHIANKERPMG